MQVTVTLTVAGNDEAFNKYDPVMVTIVPGAQYIAGGIINANTVHNSLTVNVTEDDGTFYIED